MATAQGLAAVVGVFAVVALVIACPVIKNARQRLVVCRLMIDIMRSVHDAYAPASEPFGARLETFFIGLCVAIGDIDGKPFSVAKIAAYMRVPRTTVIRRLDQLQSWGLIDRRGRHYYLHETALNSANGMRTYQQVRRILSRATKELTILDVLPD
jgi:predicted ArsR family transcriptional regulator